MSAADDRRARQFVIADLETAAERNFAEAHKNGQLAAGAATDQLRADYLEQGAECTRRGLLYQQSADRLKTGPGLAGAAAPAKSGSRAA